MFYFGVTFLQILQIYWKKTEMTLFKKIIFNITHFIIESDIYYIDFGKIYNQSYIAPEFFLHSV